MLAGADTHSGYGQIDVAAFKAAGGRFIWAKCTEGNENFVDEQFHATVASCRAEDVPVGGYHFLETLDEDDAHPGRSPEDQVERYWNASNGLGSQSGDLAHVVDIEWPAPQDMAKWKLTAQKFSDRARRYCEAWTKRAGRKPVIYTYPNEWRWLEQNADVSWASEYMVVWADYGWPGEGTPPVDWTPPHWGWQKTWSDWAACQYSAEGSTARVPGINACPVDRDCIRSETMLLRLRGMWEPGIPDQATVHPTIDFDDDVTAS